MNNDFKKLAVFISNNIDEIKNEFIGRKLSIADPVAITQDSDGTITAWPDDLITDLWFEHGMWFADNADDTSQSNTIFCNDVVFPDHMTNITFIHTGIGCIEYEDDVTETTSYQKTKVH